MAKRKQTVKVRMHKGLTWEFIPTESYYSAKGWHVTRINPRDSKPLRSGSFRYVLTHEKTGQSAGRFATQRAAIACCREVSTLPCSAYLDSEGTQRWPNYEVESKAIAAVLQKWVDSEKDKAV